MGKVRGASLRGGNLRREGLATLTLTLDRVILHTVVHHSSTSTYMPNFIETEETFCERTDGCTHVRTDGHLRPALLGQLCAFFGVDAAKQVQLHSFLN